MKWPLRRLIEFETHHRLAIALGCALVTLLILLPLARPSVAVMVSWDVFAVCFLAMGWSGMLILDAATRVREAQLPDSSRAVIYGCVATGATAALFGAGHLLSVARSISNGSRGAYIAIAALAVASAWLLVHTMLTIHYTHLCYHIAEDSTAQPADLGVIFPNEPNPDYLDFAYFSFVIGMTCQVSDVQITSRVIRRVALAHGLLSFTFNTVILAISLNLAVGLL